MATKTKVVYNSYKEFKTNDFIVPVLNAMNELSSCTSNGVYYREELLDWITRKYIVLNGTAKTRLHKTAQNPLWEHVVDLVLSYLRDAHILEDYDFRRGMYCNFNEDTKEYINSNTNEYLTSEISNNFQVCKDLVKNWRKENPKKAKITLIKKNGIVKTSLVTMNN